MKACFAILKAVFLKDAAVRIAFIYASFSALWILFSDQILFFYFKEAETLTRLQMLKGWFFILITALVIYYLLRKEITKSRQAEDQARENERKLNTLMDNLPGMAYRCRNDQYRTMEFISNGCLEVTGYRPADLMGNRLIGYNELIQPADQQAVWATIQQALAQKQPFQLTYRLLAATGQEKWLWEQGVGVFAEAGDLLTLEGFITDITERKQAEEALHLYRAHLEDLVKKRTATLEQEIVEKQRAEKKFRDLLEGAPDAMALVDTNGRMVMVNRQMEKLFGYARAELLEHNIEILIPERFRAKHRQYVKDYFISYRARPMGQPLDIFALRKDGREFPGDISLSPLETAEGIFVLADIRDITERKKAEAKIKKSFYFESTLNAVLKISLAPQALEEQLESILDLILAIPLLSLQKMGSIYLVEDQPEVLVLKAHRGYDQAVLTECARVPFGQCHCGEAAATATTIFAGCLATCHKCYRGVFPHGHYCTPIVSGRQVLGVLNLVLKDGHARDNQEEEFFSAIAATLAGIIERWKTESEKEGLQRQLVESEKLSALGRMMENVAHEIGNPLTAVGGLARRLDKKVPAGTKEKEYSKVIMAESARLERILKSVLTFTKEPNGHFEENDLNAIIAESVQANELSFTAKSLAVRTSLADLPHLALNREDVREVIDNLLANAVYATPAGGTILIVTDKEDLEGTTYITVKVTDTGAGIAEDKLGMIFEPFFSTKPVGPGHGIGLGLSISRKIMEEHGGLIRVASKVGAGTTFSLFFPIRA